MSGNDQFFHTFGGAHAGSKFAARDAAAETHGGDTIQSIDEREDRLFRSLDVDNDQQVRRSDLVHRLKKVGLMADDRRLRDSLGAIDRLLRMEEAARDRQETGITRDAFCRAIRHNILLIERALQGNLVIPNFSEFCTEIDYIHAETSLVRTGEAADYIPELDLKGDELDQYGIGICTVDGQRHSVGEADRFFPVQSMCKPISYCLALEEHGQEFVHAHIGHEPSGASFNELTLDQENRPHNPMINAGAIMASALIGLSGRRDAAANAGTDGATYDTDPRGKAGRRFDRVMGRWQDACGGVKPRFGTPVYLSERETADRNFALAYFMREKGAFPAGVDLHDVLEFYFQSCSIEVTAEMMAVVAATLANGGICPTSGERVFRTETVRSCLSMMASCGMYDFSGEFAFTIGLPAKSGVCGGIMVVIPNIMGFCVWSPRLDEHGNSVRGIEFCRHLVRGFNFHNFDALAGASGKRDPRISRTRFQASRINELIWAASKGDLGAIHNQLLRGAKLSCADYDQRTPLHLAAAENQVEVVRFFVEEKQRGANVDLNPRDRWGGTPLEDAVRYGNTAVVEILESAGGVRAATRVPARRSVGSTVAGTAEQHKAAEMIWAASEGDLAAILQLVAQGVPLDIADYDLRTPLHLASAEGKIDVVDYFVTQGADLEPRDRWGNTPLDDAVRHDRAAVAERLRAASAAGEPSSVARSG